MNKIKAKTDVKVGDVVAFNNLPDATWFTVEAINGFTLTIRELRGFAPQYIDKSLVKRIRKAAP